MHFQTGPAPHVVYGIDVPRIMRRVLYALLPGIAALFWVFGWGVLLQIVIASFAALLGEALILRWRGYPVRRFLSDGSALVSAWLLALSIPPLSPWWLVFTGSVFAIVIAKQLYGGLGHNPFNPAMVGYAVLLISFPLEMTRWVLPAPIAQHQPTFIETVEIVFNGQMGNIDALTGATLLDTIKTQLNQGMGVADVLSSPLFGYIAGSGWEWSSIGFALGGLWLVVSGIADWRIAVATLLGLLLPAGVFHWYDPAHYASPGLHLFAGATVLGAFFIATDPVSASTTPFGRVIYGAGIGLLTYIIRVFGGYPDGIAFAVLLMNLTAPAIDYFTRPRVFGGRR